MSKIAHHYADKIVLLDGMTIAKWGAGKGRVVGWIPGPGLPPNAGDRVVIELTTWPPGFIGVTMSALSHTFQPVAACRPNARYMTVDEISIVGLAAPASISTGIGLSGGGGGGGGMIPVPSRLPPPPAGFYTSKVRLPGFLDEIKLDFGFGPDAGRISYKAKDRKKEIPEYPHTCPRCKAPACILFSSIACSKKCH